MSRLASLFASLLILLLAGALCQADSGANEAMFRLQSTIQRLTQENAELEQKNNELSTKLTAAEAQAKGAGQRKSGDAARDAAFAAARERLEQNNALLLKASVDARQRIVAAMARQNEMQAQLKSLQVQRDQATKLAEATSAATIARVQACETNNIALHDIGMQLIGEYERKGLWTVIASHEPVTQLKRAQLANLMDDYRRKIVSLYRDIGGAAASVGTARTAAGIREATGAQPTVTEPDDSAHHAEALH